MSFAISFADVQAAEARLRNHLPPSPLIPLDVLSAEINRDVWCKLKAVYPTGALEEIGKALVYFLMKERLLLEGAAATALACLMRGRIEDFPGPVVLLGCGRNIDPAVVIGLTHKESTCSD